MELGIRTGRKIRAVRGLATPGFGVADSCSSPQTCERRAPAR
jgi:hypothetical protein